MGSIVVGDGCESWVVGSGLMGADSVDSNVGGTDTIGVGESEVGELGMMDVAGTIRPIGDEIGSREAIDVAGSLGRMDVAGSLGTIVEADPLATIGAADSLGTIFIAGPLGIIGVADSLGTIVGKMG